MGNDWKQRLNVVYSTNPDYKYETDAGEEQETLPPAQQKLCISLDRSGRAGKTVTLVTGFVGTTTDVKHLGRQLKTLCGVGGTVKNQEILVQGDCRQKILHCLSGLGYSVKCK